MALSNPATGQEIINEINNKVNKNGDTISGDLSVSGSVKTNILKDTQGNQMLAKKSGNVVGSDDLPLGQIVSGSYTGDGESERVINLGFTPKFVLIKRQTTVFAGDASCTGGVPTLVLNSSSVYNSVGGVNGASVVICEVVNSGFKVCYGSGASNFRDLNNNNSVYHYVAGK